MLTTPYLRNEFERAFKRIIKMHQPELQKKRDGVIGWPDELSYTVIELEIIRQLLSAPRYMYASLLSKISRS